MQSLAFTSNVLCDQKHACKQTLSLKDTQTEGLGTTTVHIENGTLTSNSAWLDLINQTDLS